MKRAPCILALSLVVVWMGVALSQPRETQFRSRWEELTKDPNQVFKVTAQRGEDIPEATLNINFGPEDLISASRGKREPPKAILKEEDIARVVNRNLRVVKFCYCRALKQDPEFSGEAIVGMNIKNSGQVSKVTIEPETISEHHFGKCLTSRVIQWRFPEFTGKKADGLRVKSVGYEFPLTFHPAE